ncbi:MAG: translation initiation factor [Clostridia bacterium]|nr:translation initiation factor [Deltaproteobacteria bacterium]
MTKPFNNPFAALEGQREKLPEVAAIPVKSAKPDAPARAVVRYERKGHGGKDMTRIEKLELNDTTIVVWLKELKSSMGCGGSVEDGTILLQGDQRERVKTWLIKRGVRRVVVS